MKHYNEVLNGVALSLSDLRHLYYMLHEGVVIDQKAVADGLVTTMIKRLELMQVMIIRNPPKQDEDEKPQ